MRVIGQDKLVGDISRVLDIFVSSNSTIRPHMIITGSSGTGKSHTVSTLTKARDIGFLEINAAQLTKEGTSGNSLSKALSPLRDMKNTQTVVFVDEFDKLFISSNQNSSVAHEITHGVQNEFLKVLETESTSTFGDYGKYVDTSVKDVLFIFAGAFNGEKDITLDKLRSYGVKTEFLGRVGLVFSTEPLTLDHLKEILISSELLNNYLQLFPEVNKDKAVKTILNFLDKSFKTNDIGARAINTLIHQFFINGGVLNPIVAEKSTFQSSLSLERV